LTGQIRQRRLFGSLTSAGSALWRRSLCFAVLGLLVLAVAPLSAAEPTAQLGTVSGTVAVTFANGSALQPAGSGTTLSPGDRISTVGKGAATIELPSVGRIELASDTTVILRDLKTDGGATRVTVELVQGMIVNQLAPAGDVRLDFRAVDPNGQAVAHATDGASFGMGRDENGNVTVACVSCGHGAVTFPTDRSDLFNGRAVTLTGRGDLVDWSFGGSVYDALAEGADADADGGDTPSGHRLPPGQRTGSRDERRGEEEDDDPGQNNAGIGTPTPTPVSGTTATPTPTVTPTATLTATPTRVPTTVQATIANFVYLPDPIEIRVGDTIRWTNLDNVPDGHTVTARDLSFTSPVLRQGDTYTRTFTQTGTFEYFCEPHPFMTGFIVVQP
jgi:plastocyanin